ncbi:MAG: glycosyl transferase family 1, partial [Pseudomonadota bacterium]|nr:glycosyl transferase family 1 [Pseudomonadota bacterium]
SNTAPVMEVITHGENGLLVDFLDNEALTASRSYSQRQTEAMQPHRQQARQTVIDRFDLHTQCLPQQLALVASLLASTA